MKKPNVKAANYLNALKTGITLLMFGDVDFKGAKLSGVL